VIVPFSKDLNPLFEGSVAQLRTTFQDDTRRFTFGMGIDDVNARTYTFNCRGEDPEIMIGHLRGTMVEKHPNQVIVETGGVGYEVQIPISTYTSLPAEGAAVSLRIYTHVREDVLALFGFSTGEEKLVFERLISVSGIGPKLAITVLSGLPTPELVAAIRNSDIDRLVRIPGVGKKTAERIVLELKEKLTGFDAGKAGTAGETGPVFTPLERDVLSALQNLGCSRPAAEDAVRKAKGRGAPQEFEPFFRAALALVR
jgi:holliday junction DNA helicase RuvA